MHSYLASARIDGEMDVKTVVFGMPVVRAAVQYPVAFAAFRLTSQFTVPVQG
jgi:hypothetical protein